MKRLKTLRTERQLSQTNLGELVGVSQQSINKYETGKAEPDIELLKDFARLFHTTVDDLIGYTDKELIYQNTETSPDALPVTVLREQNTSISQPIFETTPSERHVISMYRKLSPEMQIHIESIIANLPKEDFPQENI